MGGTHFFGEHPPELKLESPFQQFIRGMWRMASDLAGAGVEVLNASPISALPYWPKVDLLHILPNSLHRLAI